MRKTQDELDKLKKEKGVDVLWSFSRFDTFRTSPYEYMLKYIKRIHEDRNDCIYTSCGSLCHDTLDKFYEGEIPYEKMIEEFEEGWTVNREIAKLCFDRCDADKDVKLAEKYYENLTHFFTHHVPIDRKVVIEPFVHLNVGKNVFIGYIDALWKDDNGNYVIVDFKSSSIFKGKSLEEHSTQLVLYAMALNQMGISLDKIRIAFNFLKYTTIQYTQANGTVKSRDVERCKIGESLQSNAKMWLKKLGYEDEIDTYLQQLLDTNDIGCLPDDVQDKYVFGDCYVYICLTQKLVDKWTTEITNIITDIELREKDYAETHSDAVFWDSEESVKSQSYYFANLCSYSANLHLPYKRYLEKLEENKNGFDIFSGVGSGISSASQENKNEKSVDNFLDDLSWLNDI